MSADTAKLKQEIRNTSIELPSLMDRVTVRRDGRGIPYIEAANEADLYFAQGYATAADRLWQMDFLRRTARGELSEILGEHAIEIDKLHRIYGFRQVAEKLVARASEQTRLALDSYARGVNAFIRACGSESLPLEFKILRYQPANWTAADSVALGKLFAEKLSITADVDILRALMSDLPREKFAALLPETSPLDVIAVGEDKTENQPISSENRPKFTETELATLTALLKEMRKLRAASGGDGQVGSNSWAVAGELSASGKPMLAGDPHLPATSPSIWHITHLSAGDLRVSGVSVPGVPGVMIGHNDSIAWGITNLCPDVQDVYLEEFDVDDPRSYKAPDGWQQAEVRTEEIRVRKPDGTFDRMTLEVKVTRHGPIVLENGTTGIALRWTACDADAVDLDTFIAINRARNWDDFVAALSGYGSPPQNFTYADTNGHIGYYCAGKIPIRRSGDGSFPYDGTTDEGDWLGFIPFAELPHVLDPPSGMIVMANQRTIGSDYRHHITHNWRVPYRAHRIKTLLEAKTKFTISDFLSIQGDTYSYPDAIFAAEVCKLATPLLDSDAQWREMFEIFGEWDGYSNSESTVLPLLVEMRKAFRRQVLTRVLGEQRTQFYEWRNESTVIDNLITQRPVDWLPAGFTSYESLLLECYREARATLFVQFGDDPKLWSWGNLGQVRFPHPLEKIGSIGAKFATPSFPQHTGGSMPSINAGSRVSMRFVADLSDWDQTRLCLPLGESGDPASEHRADQLSDWRNVSPPVLPFSDEAIATATREVLIMTPATT